VSLPTPTQSSVVQVTSSGPDSCHPQIVFTGTQRFLLWFEKPGSDYLYQVEIDDAGNPIGDVATVGTDGNAPKDMDAIWTGSAIASVWTTRQSVTFSLSDTSGNVLTDSVEMLDAEGVTHRIDLASNGTSLAAAYQAGPADGYSVRLVTFDDAGVPGTPVDLTSAAGANGNPEVSWTGSNFTALWQEGPELMARTASASGVLGPEQPAIDSGVVPGISSVWAGDRMGVTFTGTESGWDQVQVAVLDGSASMMGSQPTVVDQDTSADASAPDIAWSGEYFGVVYLRQWLFFALVDRDGNQVGEAIPIEGGALAEFPDITWAGDRFMLSWQAYDQNDDYQLFATTINLSATQ
jgi:hypothetical protein